MLILIDSGAALQSISTMIPTFPGMYGDIMCTNNTERSSGGVCAFQGMFLSNKYISGIDLIDTSDLLDNRSNI